MLAVKKTGFFCRSLSLDFISNVKVDCGHLITKSDKYFRKSVEFQELNKQSRFLLSKNDNRKKWEQSIRFNLSLLQFISTIFQGNLIIQTGRIVKVIISCSFKLEFASLNIWSWCKYLALPAADRLGLFFFFNNLFLNTNILKKSMLKIANIILCTGKQFISISKLNFPFFDKKNQGL